MTLKIVAISGSLEKNSANSGLIRACLTVKNSEVHIEVADISTFPLFNMDIVIEKGFPPEVEYVRQKIYSSHALLFSTPSRNNKISAALKNAYDWLSFTPDAAIAPPVKYLVAGIMCASSTGGDKAIEHLRRVFQYCKVKSLPNALQIIKSEENFNHNGDVIGTEALGRIRGYLENLADFVNENKKAS